MTLYSSWIKENRYNPNKSYYSYWKDDYTYIVGAYDKETGDGIERELLVNHEYKINKLNEIREDLRLYTE